MATEETMVIACTSLVFCAMGAEYIKSDSTQCGWYETPWQRQSSDTRRHVRHDKTCCAQQMFVGLNALVIACRVVLSRVEIGLNCHQRTLMPPPAVRSSGHIVASAQWHTQRENLLVQPFFLTASSDFLFELCVYAKILFRLCCNPNKS